MKDSKIQWTDATWNPIRGCSKVSAGCANCYAEKQAARFSGGPSQPYFGLVRSGRWTGKVRVVQKHLHDPLRWRKPRMVFVNSMSDLFHENLSDEDIDRIFAVMAAAPYHTFQVLTKRADRMRAYMNADDVSRRVDEAMCELANARPTPEPGWDGQWPPRNVWNGVSVEDQASADERVSALQSTRAAVRFISAEPLLGQLDLRKWMRHTSERVYQGRTTPSGKDLSRCLVCDAESPGHEKECYSFQMNYAPIHWVIIGGESGPGARPCEVAWIRSLVEQCRAGGLAAFVKQLGAQPVDRNDAGFHGDSDLETSWPDGPEPIDLGRSYDHQGAAVGVRLKHPKGGDPQEWPEDLRVREWPTHPAEGGGEPHRD